MTVKDKIEKYLAEQVEESRRPKSYRVHELTDGFSVVFRTGNFSVTLDCFEGEPPAVKTMTASMTLEEASNYNTLLSVVIGIAIIFN